MTIGDAVADGQADGVLEPVGGIVVVVGLGVLPPVEEDEEDEEEECLVRPTPKPTAKAMTAMMHIANINGRRCRLRRPPGRRILVACDDFSMVPIICYIAIDSGWRDGVDDIRERTPHASRCRRAPLGRIHLFLQVVHPVTQKMT